MSKELRGAPIMTWADEMSYFFGGKLVLVVTSDRRRTSTNYAQVYLPGSRNQDDTQAGQEVTGKVYDESLSSIMVGLNVAKEIVPKGIQDADNDVQWDFVAECIRSWSSKQSVPGPSNSQYFLVLI